MRGAYGVSVVGDEFELSALPTAASGWPRWQIGWSPVATHVAGGETLQVNVGGYLDLQFAERRCVIATADRPSSGAFAHPWLATIGACVANAAGHDTFHGGGVVVDGRCWVVLGAKESGKSTTLAALHRLGYVVTSDDLVVLDGDRSLSGPACIDLRRRSAEGLGIGTRTTLMPGRERWRVELPAPPAQTRLAGFVLPDWSDGEASARPLPVPDRLGLLYGSRAALWRDNRAERMLELASLPMLRWQRPRSLDRLDEYLDLLLAQLRTA